MTEHVIRLRGGWECHSGHCEDAVTRITLPVCWPLGFPSRVRLTRSFQRPNVDQEREAISLRLEDVTGLAELKLNGSPVPLPDRRSCLEIPLEHELPARNRLALEVELAPLERDGTGATAPWGSIALVITRRDDAGPNAV